MRTGSWIVTTSRIVSVAAVVVLLGMLPWLSDRDPAMSILRARSAEQEATPEALDSIRRELGLDAGPLRIFSNWITGIIQGDPGRSWNTGRPVLPGALDALGVSLTLMAFAMIVALAITTLVVLPAMRAGLRGTPRRTGGAAAAALTSLPEFLLASVLVVVGAVWLSFPAYGWNGPEYVVLPALALGLPAGGLMGRLLADAVAVTFTEEWVTTWTVAGFSKRSIAVAVVRRALPGLASQIGLIMVAMTGGAVAVERFSRYQDWANDARRRAVSRPPRPAARHTAVARGERKSRHRRGSAQTRNARKCTAGPRDAHSVPRLCAVFASVDHTDRGRLGTGDHRRRGTSTRSVGDQPREVRRTVGRVPLRGRRIRTGSVGPSVRRRDPDDRTVSGCNPRMLGRRCVVRSGPPGLSWTRRGHQRRAAGYRGYSGAAIWGPSAGGAAIAVLIVTWAPLAAHTAALVEETRVRPYIAILPTLGASEAHILFGSILPSVLPAVFRHAMMRLPGVALR